MRITIFLIAVIFSVTLLGFSLNANPLRGASNSSQTEVKQPNAVTKAWGWVLQQQRTLNREVTNLLSASKENKSPKIILYGFLLSFLYGILHALGPGHGKVLIISYFSVRKSKIWYAPLMGFQIAFTHVASAIILVLLTNRIARNIVLSFRPSLEFTVIKIASYSLIFLIGCFMLWQTYKNNRTCGCGSHNHQNNRASWLLSVSIGFVPCTGSLLLLLFTMSHGILSLGIFFVLALALGTAVTLSLIGILCIKGFDLLSSSTKFEKRADFAKIIGYASSFMIIAIGLTMLILNVKDLNL